MRRFIACAILAASVLAAPAVYAGNNNDQGRDGVRLPETNIWGLPVTGPVVTSTPVKLLTADEVLPKPGHERDIVEIIQLQGLYEFYHDGHNGPGVASLFTPDGIFPGIFEMPLNDANGDLSPQGGTTEIGVGCAAYGTAEITTSFNAGVAVPLPWTALRHHVMTSPVVTFSKDGNFATLIANFVDDMKSGSPLATTWGNEGEYMDDFVRTKDGWKFVHLRAIEDQPSTSCGLANVPVTH